MEPRQPDPREATTSGGEVVPPAARRVLDRAPSERYTTAVGASPEDSGPRTGSLAKAAVWAIAPAAAGAAGLVAFGSPLAWIEPLVVVAAALGLVAGLGARWGGGATVSRRRRRAVAVGVALIAVALAEFVVWRFAIGEGGVLPFVEFELQVFGPVAVLQPLAAGLSAWASA